MSRPVYLVDGARTPFLKARTGPGPFTPVDLAVQCGRPLLARQPFGPEAIDLVVLGCVNVIPDEMNPARIAALRLGLGETQVAFTVQINCGSGMQSIDTAYRYVRDGSHDIILAGRAEAISHAPLVFRKEAVEWYAGLAKTGGPVRCRARAQHEGLLSDEVLPAFDRDGTIHDHDDGVRPDTDTDKLAELQPAFERPYGKVIPGNSSQVTDGASWVIVASEDAAERHGLSPLARIVDSDWAALDPSIMGLGPVLSSTSILGRQKLEREDIDLWEINEASVSPRFGWACIPASAARSGWRA